MTWRLGRVMAGWMTAVEVAAKLKVGPTDVPNVRGQLTAACRAGLVELRVKSISGKLWNQYRWRS
jgi:hypothetical protein